MLSISHSLTGAFIASQVPIPIVYGPLTLAAHYLEDWIPHWDFGTGISTGKRSKKAAIFFEIGELIIAIVLIYFFFQQDSSKIRWHIWIAALLGILPDLVDAPRNFSKVHLKFLDPFFDFHHHLHHSTSRVVFGLIPQIIVVGLIFLLIK